MGRPTAHESRGWKVSFYRAALSGHTKFQELTSAALVGVFLGLFDPDDRARIDEEYYDSARELMEGKQRRYDDEAMVDSGLFEWERRAIEEHFEPGSSVAVLGAGAGREVLALLEAGFDARGYDPHPGLVSRGARLLAERGYPDRVRLSERDSMPAEPAQLDAVVIGWGAYTLICGRRRRVALLRQAAASLRPGSPVLLSFFPIPERTRQLRLAHAIARRVARVRGAEPPELGDWLTPNFVHYFDEGAIRAELAEAGFRLRGWWHEPYGHAVGALEAGRHHQVARPSESQ